MAIPDTIASTALRSGNKWATSKRFDSQPS